MPEAKVRQPAYAIALAIILGAMIVGSAVVGAQFMHSYEIAAGVPGGSGGLPFAWRVNVRTGEIEICNFTVNSNPFDAPDVPKGGTRFDLSCKQSLVGTPTSP
jgi:hypothetical protein